MSDKPKFEFDLGHTDPVGDCENYEAAIDVTEHGFTWFARIAVYGSSPAEAEELRRVVMHALENRGKPCDHLFEFFGSQKRRRCNWCSTLEPLPACAATGCAIERKEGSLFCSWHKTAASRTGKFGSPTNEQLANMMQRDGEQQ